jgi:hypothetical protein
MNESIGGVVLGVIGALGLTYLVVKVRQNQRRLHRMVGVIHNQHASDIQYLFDLAETGQLKPYAEMASAPA